MNRIRSFMITAMTVALLGAAAFAQVDTQPAQPTQPAQQSQPAAEPMTRADTTTTSTAPRNDGFNWGWLGLAGLIGLVGLKNRDAHTVERDTTRHSTRTDGTTAPRGTI